MKTYVSPQSMFPLQDPFCPKMCELQAVLLAISKKCSPQTLRPTDSYRQINSDQFKST